MYTILTHKIFFFLLALDEELIIKMSDTNLRTKYPLHHYKYSYDKI